MDHQAEMVTTVDTKELLIILLRLEVEALRSVLSEFDGDKQEYTQMIKANAIENLRMAL